MTYNQYMDQMIDSIILQQEKAIDETKSQALLLQQPPSVWDSKSSCNDLCTDAVIPSIFENLCDSAPCTYGPARDATFPEKTKGFVNHIVSIFQCIGPHRAPVDISIVEQCVEIANVIRAIGVPNYRQARIPLVSGLNIEAWEAYLKDYPDPLLIEYLKFAFPLSMLEQNTLNTTTVVNHHSYLSLTSLDRDNRGEQWRKE